MAYPETLSRVVYGIAACIKSNYKEYDCNSPPLISYEDLRSVLEDCRKILLKQPAFPIISPPITVVSDIHGQLVDLLRIFRHGGWPPTTRYVFLGDYVDRGPLGVEVFILLAALKCKFPDDVWLLRGNHESDRVNTRYGFRDEVQRKYGMLYHRAYKLFSDVFNCLPLAALIEETPSPVPKVVKSALKNASAGETTEKTVPSSVSASDEASLSGDSEPAKSPAESTTVSKTTVPTSKEHEQSSSTLEAPKRIFITHGGLSPDLKSFSQLQNMARPYEIPCYGLECDLAWADPEQGQQGWAQSSRNLSFTFGEDVAVDFCKRFGVSMIVRGHQVPSETPSMCRGSKSRPVHRKPVPKRGYRFFAGTRLLTLFSVPNYMGITRNEGTVLCVKPNFVCQLVTLRPSKRVRLTYEPET